MFTSRRLPALFLLLAACALLRGAPTSAEAEPPPFTARELQQGYRSGLILARPHAHLRARAEAEEAREGVRVRERLERFHDLRIIELDAGDTPEAAISRLRATGRYEFVEPDHLRHIAAEPNDPQFLNGALWALRNSGQSAGVAGADIKAVPAWDIIRDASSVVVAVVDTGINLNHQDLAANLWRNPNPTFGDVNGARFLNGAQSGNPADDNGHGTHVAGTIGALGDNGLAVTGIAWKVQIMAVKVFPASGGGSVSDIARGVNYAIARGARIINASYGALSNTGFSNTELAAITAARDAGVIFVAAAGNAAANMDIARFYPAAHALDNVVTVGNSTRRDELSLSSNYGSAVDLFAPGSEIVSLNYASNTGTTTLSGTSMAAPHVTGALALLRARFPTDTHRQLINRLLRGVDPGDRFVNRAQTGGRLNVLRALLTGDDPDGNLPFNDAFARRPRLSSDNLAIRSSNAGATREAGEPDLAGQPPAATLWWEWTAPTSTLVSIDTAGSGYDTVLGVFTGTSVDALTPVASNDDDAGKVTSRISFAARAGTTYQIAVGGKAGATGLTLLNVGTTPANDAFDSPVILAGESALATGTNARATLETGEPRIPGYAGGTSLWYRWTAPRAGRFQISTVSSDFDPILAVYQGGSLPGLSLVNATANATANDRSNGATWTLEATAGTTYLITVDAKDPRAVGQFTVSVADSRWQFRVAEGITGAPTIGRDGTAYFGSLDQSVYAVAADGTLRWSYATGSTIDTAAPAVGDDGNVYVGSNDGTVYSFQPDGTPRWTRVFGTTAPVSNSPAVGIDGTVYIKAGDGWLYALAPADGTIRWRFNVNATTSYASPAVGPDGTIYQGSEDKKLYAIRPDGTLKWTFTAENDIYTVPAIDAEGNLYFGVLGTGRLYSVSPTGVLRWTYAGTSLGSSSSPALSPDGSTAYFGGYDKRLHAVATSNGTARWTYLLGDEVRASCPAVDANGTIYIGAYDFRLHAINPDGTLRRTYAAGNWIRSSPAIFGNTLYVGSNDRKLYAFDLPAGPGGGPWSQYRQNARRTGRAGAETFALTSTPESQVTFPGERLTLSVVATGPGPLAYQWFKDGMALPGATGGSYTLAAAAFSDAGGYAVTVTGPAGSLTSTPALIRVETPEPGRLVNLSVRTTAGTGAETLTVGLVVRGTPPKPLLVRGVGPALAGFGLTGVLARAQVQVLDSAAKPIATNAGWDADGNGAAIAAAAPAVGAFALNPGSGDAAVLASLAAGNYTVQVTGPGGATGLALAEVYDRDPVTATDPANVSRLVNLSARAQVGSGANLLIAGFAVSGNQPRQVLIRGLGPVLSAFGLTGLLANPRLELYRGTTKIQDNDDWGGTTALTRAFGQVGAFPIANATSRDAVLLVTLLPGSYSVQLSGVGGTTGVGLLEVYEVP